MSNKAKNGMPELGATFRRRGNPSSEPWICGCSPDDRSCAFAAMKIMGGQIMTQIPLINGRSDP